MQEYYKAFPVIAKIFYKQNRNDNVKGADSIHITLDDKNKFEFWYGEAKFFTELNNKNFTNLMTSIQDLLDTEKLKKENIAVINSTDLRHILENINQSEEVYNSILSNITKFLQGSIDDFKTILHVPIVILYQCDITAKNERKTQEYLDKIKTKHKSIAKKYFSEYHATIKISYIEEIKFHLILFPVPDKQKIIEIHKDNIEHFQRKL